MRRSRKSNIGEIIRQRRISIPLTFSEMVSLCGVSSSYLRRIERGERSPSGTVLRKIAGALGFTESELFILAGYLTPKRRAGNATRLDPYVAWVLSREEIEVQRTVLTILTMAKVCRMFKKSMVERYFEIKGSQATG